MSFNPNMANREVANLVFLDYKEKVPVLNLDYANVTTTGLEASRVFAKGGQGAPNRIGFDGERTGTLTIETQITPMKLYGIVSGSGIKTVAKYVKREELASESNKITLSSTPIVDSVNVFATDDDCGTPVKIVCSGKEITIEDGTTSNKKFIAYYIVSVESGAQTVKFTSKTFPKAFTIYGSTPWKTEDEEIVEMKLTYYKAQPQSAISLSFSSTGDPTSLSVVCDLYADENDDIYDMSIIDDEDENENP